MSMMSKTNSEQKSSLKSKTKTFIKDHQESIKEHLKEEFSEFKEMLANEVKEFSHRLVEKAEMFLITKERELMEKAKEFLKEKLDKFIHDKEDELFEKTFGFIEDKVESAILGVEDKVKSSLSKTVESVKEKAMNFKNKTLENVKEKIESKVYGSIENTGYSEERQMLNNSINIIYDNVDNYPIELKNIDYTRSEITDEDIEYLQSFSQTNLSFLYDKDTYSMKYFTRYLNNVYKDFKKQLINGEQKEQLEYLYNTEYNLLLSLIILNDNNLGYQVGNIVYDKLYKNSETFNHFDLASSTNQQKYKNLIKKIVDNYSAVNQLLAYPIIGTNYFDYYFIDNEDNELYVMFENVNN